MLCCQLCFVQGRERVRSPPHSDTSSSGSRGGDSVSLASLGVTIGDRVVIGAGTSRQPKVRLELAFLQMVSSQFLYLVHFTIYGIIWFLCFSSFC